MFLLRTFLLLTLALTIPVQTLAAECPNAVLLKIGDTVKDCDRIGLSKEYDLGLRKDLIEADYNKEVIVEQKKMLDLKDITVQTYSKKSDLWEQEAMRSRELVDAERNRNEKWFWVGIASGILLTLGAAWGYGQVAK